MPQLDALGAFVGIMCDVCRCAEYAHVLPAQAFIEELSSSSEDGDAAQDSSTQISRRVALPLRSEANKYTQAQQNAYEKKLGALRKNIRTYVSTCDTSTLNRYLFHFTQIWKLFLELDALGIDKGENEEMRDLVQEIANLNQQINIDDYTRIFMAAYWAFFVRYKQTDDKTIPFLFFYFCLHHKGKTKKDQRLILRNISEYRKSTDLSSDLQASTANENQFWIDHIFKIVRMLQLYQYLYDFCTGKYDSWDKLETAWQNLMRAYAAYKREPLELIFDDYFTQTSQKDMQVAVGKTLEVQEIDNILEKKSLRLAVQKIGLPELLSVRESKIRHEKLYKDLIQVFHKQQRLTALNRVSTELTAISAQTQQDADKKNKALKQRLTAPNRVSTELTAISAQTQQDADKKNKALKQRLTALNHVSTEVTAISAPTQQDADEKIKGLIELYAEDLSHAVDRMLTHYEEIQALQKLSTQVDALIESGVHTTPSQGLARKLIGKIFSSRNNPLNTTDTNTKTMEMKVLSETGGDSRATSTNDAKENDADESIRIEELLELIHKFCTLEKTSVSALEKLWVKITEIYNGLKYLSGLVGTFFNKAYPELQVDSVGIHRFCTATTFKEAVQHIGLKQLVERARVRPTKNQSTRIADAYMCKIELDELSKFCGHLKDIDIDTKGQSYATVQKTASTLEAELDKALGQLREEREVLPRLLEELQGLTA